MAVGDIVCTHCARHGAKPSANIEKTVSASHNYNDYGNHHDDDDDDDWRPRRRIGGRLLPRKARFLIFMLVVGAIIGLIITGLVSLMINEKFDAQAAFVGLRNGISISALFWVYLAVVEPAGFGKYLKRRPFILSAVIRGMIFSGLITIGLVVNRLVAVWLWGEPGWPAYFLDGSLLREAGLSLVFSLVVIFLLDVSKLIGPRVLTNIVLGRYHQPVREDRAFMFLDVRGATALAERIGDERTHEFLTRFFFDIDPIILRWDGEVVTYLGDGVMITWPLEEALDRSSPLEFLADVMGWVVANAPKYQEKYGAIPTFRAGLHGGDVVAGECGSSKREIAYVGDVVNIAARLEQACKRTRYVALASAEMVRRMALPEGMVIDRLGAMRLRGREQQTEVVGIRMVRARH